MRVRGDRTYQHEGATSLVLSLIVKVSRQPTYFLGKTSFKDSPFSDRLIARSRLFKTAAHCSF